MPLTLVIPWRASAIGRLRRCRSVRQRTLGEARTSRGPFDTRGLLERAPVGDFKIRGPLAAAAQVGSVVSSPERLERKVGSCALLAFPLANACGSPVSAGGGEADINWLASRSRFVENDPEQTLRS
jgi:hypothetical protein